MTKKDLNDLFKESLDYTRFRTKLVNAGSEGDYILTFSKKKLDISFTLSVTTGEIPLFVELDANLEGLSAVSKENLIALLPSAGSDFEQDLLPNELQLLGQLELTHLRIDISPRTERVNWFSTGVKIDLTEIDFLSSFSLFEGFITLQSLGLTIEYTHRDFTPDIWEFTLWGQVEIGALPLEMGIQVPSKVVYGMLPEGATVTTAELISSIGGNLAEDSPLNLTLSSLYFQGNLEEDGLVFQMRIEGTQDFKLGPSTFRLHDVSFEFDRGTGGSLSGWVATVFSIAGVDIELFAGYTGAGWTFKGATGPGQEIPIGHFFTHLSEILGDILEADLTPPDAIANLTLSDIQVQFETETNSFEFSLAVHFPLGDHEMDLWLKVHKAGEGEIEVRGEFIYDESHTFTVDFEKSTRSTLVLASYVNAEGWQIPVNALLDPINPDLAQYLPDISLLLKDAFISLVKQDPDPWRFLFGLDIGLNIGFDLTHLPLFGDKLPGDLHFKLENLRVIAASADLSASEVDSINTILAAASITEIPLKVGAEAANHPALKRGFTVSANFDVSDFTQGLDLNWTSAVKRQDTLEGGSEGAANTPQQNSKVQKTLGPLHIEKIGMGFHAGALKFDITGSISLAGLQLSLMGLQVSSPLDEFDPKFSLRGLGMDFKRGPLEMGAAFLRETYNIGQADEYEEYAGELTVKFKVLTLAGMGAYAKFEGHPSLFLYAFLGYPFGGPPFFFVNGLAMGFGINRDFVAPPVDKIADFPLIRAALPAPPIPQSAAKSSLESMMADLHTYLPPKVGEYWLAAGIRFTSFGIISNFSLAIVKFGHDFEVDLLGVASLTVPTAFVELQYSARFVPAEGYFMARGELSSRSYLYAPEVHLTGGFGVGFWLAGENNGDFVVSLGGYHPQFEVPAHYPQNIPRLGLNWHLSDEMSIKGGLYFALTPKAIMAGGFLDASFDGGIIKAWLKINADFIIFWQPFHYDAQVRIEVHAEADLDLGLFDVSISMSLVVLVHVWGPDFSGVASLDLGVKTFEIEFGAGASLDPSPISYEAFKENFLPKRKDDPSRYDICSLSIAEGLVAKRNWVPSGGVKEEIWIVNPKEMVLVTDSVIPFTRYQFSGDEFDLATAQMLDSVSFLDSQKTKSASLGEEGRLVLMPEEEARGTTTPATPGIAPVAAQDFVSGQQLKVYKHGRGEPLAVPGELRYAPILKNMPAALWGTALPDSKYLDDGKPKIVSDALTGFEIRPANPPAGGESHEMDRRILAFNLDQYAGDFDLSGEFDFDTSSAEITPEENWMVTQAGKRDAIVGAFSEYTGVAAVTAQDLPDMGAQNSLDLLSDPVFGTLVTA